MKTNLIALLFVIMAMAAGCDPTNNGTVSILPEDGFISGTFETARSNGQPLTFPFEYTLVDYPTNFYTEYGSQVIWIYRSENFETDWNGDAYGRLGIRLDSLNQDTVAFYSCYVNATVPLQNDTIFQGGMNTSSGGRILTYEYDASSQTISGTYTVSGNGYNGQPATINGSFRSKVRILADSGGND